MNIKLYVPEYKKEEFKKKCEELGLRLIISKNSMFDYSFYFTEIENNFIRHGMDFDHFEQDERKEITIDEFLKLETLDEPVNRTHEEIMDRNNWFCVFSARGIYTQIQDYCREDRRYLIHGQWHKKEFFNTLKMSKGTPPE